MIDSFLVSLFFLQPALKRIYKYLCSPVYFRELQIFDKSHSEFINFYSILLISAANFFLNFFNIPVMFFNKFCIIFLMSMLLLVYKFYSLNVWMFVFYTVGVNIISRIIYTSIGKYIYLKSLKLNKKDIKNRTKKVNFAAKIIERMGQVAMFGTSLIVNKIHKDGKQADLYMQYFIYSTGLLYIFFLYISDYNIVSENTENENVEAKKNVLVASEQNFFMSTLLISVFPTFHKYSSNFLFKELKILDFVYTFSSLFDILLVVSMFKFKLFKLHTKNFLLSLIVIQLTLSVSYSVDIKNIVGNNKFVTIYHCVLESLNKIGSGFSMIYMNNYIMEYLNDNRDRIHKSYMKSFRYQSINFVVVYVICTYAIYVMGDQVTTKETVIRNLYKVMVVFNLFLLPFYYKLYKRLN